MKRRVFYAVVLILMAVSFTACEELLEECKMCELVKYVNNVEDDRGDPIEYCGATLAAKEALGTYDIGINVTAKWDCQ
ncbi:MAG: hypothetical protein MZV63_14590 [Marinilabiliales bacterium]|nr:hypothetical protein [Marinilabiliales bacterium]